MKQKKDLFESIKDKGQGLEIKPSAGAWDRLEQRLDRRPVKRGFPIRYLFSIAASLVVLIVCIAVFQPFQQKSASMDTAALATPAFETHSIEVYSEEEQGFYKVVEFQRKHQDRLANPGVTEGNRKKLEVSKTLLLNRNRD